MDSAVPTVAESARSAAPASAPATRAGLGRALVAIAVAGVVAGLGGVTLLLTDDEPRSVPFAVFALVIAWSFIGTGLYAWWRRPDTRVGALMVAVGFAWLLNALTSTNVPAVWVVGTLLGNLWLVLLFELLLTFPRGRLRTSQERLVAAGAWISGVALQVPPVLFLATPDPEECKGCPENPLLVADDETAAQVLFDLQAAVAIASVVGLLVLLVRRWRGATPAQRGAFVPVLWVGGITLALLAIQLAAQAVNVSEDVPDAIFGLLLVPFASLPFAFLIGLLRTHLSHESAVAVLLDRLRRPVDGGKLRDLVAEALGDPSLELGYWLPEEGRYVDHAGRDQQPDAERFVSVVERDGRRVGALICDPALGEEPRLVGSVGAAAALALDNERLEAELRARLEELRASRARIVEAGDTERRRLERDLHDGAQQRLVALALMLRLRRDRAADPEVRQWLDEALAELQAATGELRELARGIHPAVLTDRGLAAAIDGLASRAPLDVDVVSVPAERLPPQVEAAAYFVVAEALTNVARYADARQARVSLTEQDGTLTVEVTDDGRGGADLKGGSGLRGLADRVAALDGRLEVESPAGEGTTVRARIPCGIRRTPAT
jgi:signal transduction histidine kinase